MPQNREWYDIWDIASSNLIGEFYTLAQAEEFCDEQEDDLSLSIAHHIGNRENVTHSCIVRKGHSDELVTACQF